MQAHIINIVYSSSVRELTEINSSFDRGVVRVAYHGKNRNGSYISKESFERSLPTIYNCPIVCNYNRETGMIGSHDIEIVKAKDGMHIVNITDPIGVIPESAQHGWELVEEDDGTTHEYLWIEALLWKRQEAYKKVKENKITNESMEITVKSGRTADGVFYIDSFEFTALCLLESVEPCYESACLETFSVDEFKAQYAEMMADFKKEFQDVNAHCGDDINAQSAQETNLEGGNDPLDKTSLLEKYGLTKDKLDFDIDALTEEELTTILEEKFGHNTDDEPEKLDDPEEVEVVIEVEVELDADTAPVAEEPQEEVAEENFSLMAEQLIEQIIDALHTEMYNDHDWGEYYRYCYYDHDPATSEVYCYDVADWNLYGFQYEMNGDNVCINFDSKKRKKISIVDFDEGDPDRNIRYSIDNIKSVVIASKDAEISEIKESMLNLETQLSELKSYRMEHEKAERDEAVASLFEQFQELDGIEAFEILKANCDDMDLDAIENKCYELKGRKTATFSVAKPKSTRLPIEGTQMDNEPYGGLFVQFPPSGR